MACKPARLAAVVVLVLLGAVAVDDPVVVPEPTWDVAVGGSVVKLFTRGGRVVEGGFAGLGVVVLEAAVAGLDVDDDSPRRSGRAASEDQRDHGDQPGPHCHPASMLHLVPLSRRRRLSIWSGDVDPYLPFCPKLSGQFRPREDAQTRGLRPRVTWHRRLTGRRGLLPSRWWAVRQLRSDARRGGDARTVVGATPTADPAVCPSPCSARRRALPTERQLVTLPWPAPHPGSGRWLPRPPGRVNSPIGDRWNNGFVKIGTRTRFFRVGTPVRTQRHSGLRQRTMRDGGPAEGHAGRGFERYIGMW